MYRGYMRQYYFLIYGKNGGFRRVVDVMLIGGAAE